MECFSLQSNGCSLMAQLNPGDLDSLHARRTAQVGPSEPRPMKNSTFQMSASQHGGF
ncbi:hypothetical protein STIAU_3958 [Stigmatella aurantiaca DW4/3-1]|uniref:Uncharacterized protein n=1 Tax=Stigmatella aurantiaca (strain DW4/3-1) TaxID=378806 RepID=Q08RI0_STIAD|nr:hypothetical protein STIAU_3958 [Stigmatella aurantiaca DW4/3-1]